MANWRNKIDIKKLFVGKSDDEIILSITKKLIVQLERIKTNDSDKIKNTFLNDEFNEVLEDFKFIQYGIENLEIPNEYCFSNWEDAFNEYLNRLYDCGDSFVYDKNGRSTGEKFLWIG